MSKEYIKECSVVAYPREIKFLHINGGSISYYVDRHISDYVYRLQQENQQLQQVNSYSKRNLYKINKDRLEANLKLVEENKKLKEQLELYDNGVIYDSRVDKLESVLDKIREYIKEHKEYLEKTKEMYINCNDELLKSTCIQLINNELVKNDNLLQTLDKVKE